VTASIIAGHHRIEDFNSLSLTVSRENRGFAHFVFCMPHACNARATTLRNSAGTSVYFPLERSYKRVTSGAPRECRYEFSRFPCPVANSAQKIPRNIGTEKRGSVSFIRPSLQSLGRHKSAQLAVPLDVSQFKL